MASTGHNLNMQHVGSYAYIAGDEPQYKPSTFSRDEHPELRHNLEDKIEILCSYRLRTGTYYTSGGHAHNLCKLHKSSNQIPDDGASLLWICRFDKTSIISSENRDPSLKFHEPHIRSCEPTLVTYLIARNNRTHL